MKMRVTKMLPNLLLGLVFAAVAGCASLGGRDTSYHPQIDPADFRTTVDNPYFPLVPGTTLKYVEDAGGETTESVTTVTPDTRVVMGVTCVVVHDVKGKGAFREESYDWYAQDKEGTVWHFGTAAKEFKSGGRVNTEGSWEAGVKDAQPGIMLKYVEKSGGETTESEITVTPDTKVVMGVTCVAVRERVKENGAL